MKKIINLYILLSAASIFILSCKKEIKYTAKPDYVPAGQSFLKFNFTSAYASNPNVQLEVNKTRVSGLITARTPFPGGGYNTGGGNYPDYLTVNSGTNEISVAIPKKGSNADSIVLLTKSISLDPDKKYTIHITDTAANIKTVLTVDDVSAPNNGTARYKFINLMPNVPMIDLYYGTTLMATGIPYLGISPSFILPAPTTNALAWSIRETGTSSTSTALATYTSSNTLLNQRVYTVFAMGYKGAADAVRKPYVSFFLNR